MHAKRLELAELLKKTLTQLLPTGIQDRESASWAHGAATLTFAAPNELRDACVRADAALAKAAQGQLSADEARELGDLLVYLLCDCLDPDPGK